MDDDARELRMATLAFLSDRYDDGTYVATPDDIKELQEATAAFLTDRADVECLCLDRAGPGLLLPGEQLLLPVHEAVSLVRSTGFQVMNLINLVDECLKTPPAQKNESHTPLLDAAVEAAQIKHTVSHAPQSSFLTRELHTDRSRSSSQELMHVGDNASNGMGPELNDNGSVFEASDVFCRFQASNAAAFVDPLADTVAPFASLDQLLEVEQDFKQLHHLYPASADDFGSDTETPEEKVNNLSDATVRICDEVDRLEVDLVGTFCDQFSMPLTAQLTDHVVLRIVTYLPTIWEESEPWSAASNSSINFAGHRGVLKSFDSRQEDFLDNNEEVLPPCNLGAECFESFFSDAIWTNAQDLDLFLSDSQPVFPGLMVEATHELLGVLITVVDAMRAHSPIDVPAFVADVKRGMHLLKEDLERLVLTNRLDEFIDLVVNRIVALDQHDATVH
jgi:hypothetical protein